MLTSCDDLISHSVFAHTGDCRLPKIASSSGCKKGYDRSHVWLSFFEEGWRCPAYMKN